MNYNIINSGSNGNATVLEKIILIDCGVSFKKLSNYYKDLKIVLLTHIHSDHFNKKTISKLAKERPTLRFACCSWLVQELLNCNIDKANIDVLEIGKKYDYKAFKVVPIYLYHDVPNCGYRIFIQDKKCIYATDTKCLDGISAKGYDLYLIEGNYSEDEIQERINQKLENNQYINEYRTMKTHLSKEQCSKFLLENMTENSEYVFMHQHVERN